MTMSAHALGTLAPDFAANVRAGLTRAPQKELPSLYLYDDVGTALFEAITYLPEYGLTRAERRIIERHAGEIAGLLRQPLFVTELGSGTGSKTRLILEALSRRRPVMYYAIDVSAAALARCRAEVAQAGSIGVVGVERPYIEGLREVAAHRAPDESALVLFLGSTIGNFDRPAAEQFLIEVRRCLHPGDALLLGTDLVKTVSEMLLAYDDPAGVTSAFNLNLLARINRELGGDFDLRAFAHEVRYFEPDRRIEMHLMSRRQQTVSVRGAGVTVPFAEGETIWTEACHKFHQDELAGIARRTGFQPAGLWVDKEWAFADSLWLAAPVRG
jgi:L-histidine N-alpha-methyltransferase